MKFTPKAGEDCETKLNSKWVRVVPMYVGSNIIVFRALGGEWEIATSAHNNTFREIQTKEQINIALIQKVLCENWGKASDIIANEIHKATYQIKVK